MLSTTAWDGTCNGREDDAGGLRAAGVAAARAVS